MKTIYRKKIRRQLKRQRAEVITQESEKQKRKKDREEQNRIELQKKIRRSLYANASKIRKLEKEVQMKKVCKHYPRKRKYLGLSQVNYDLF